MNVAFDESVWMSRDGMAISTMRCILCVVLPVD